MWCLHPSAARSVAARQLLAEPTVAQSPGRARTVGEGLSPGNPPSVCWCVLQSDAALFKRLCPADREGKMSFAPVMLTRLRKLGIEKTDPAQLTEEEQSRREPLTL